MASGPGSKQTKWRRFKIMTPNEGYFPPYVKEEKDIDRSTRKGVKDRPEHRLYNLCKFKGRQPPSEHLGKLKFLRKKPPKAPEEELLEEEKKIWNTVQKLIIDARKPYENAKNKAEKEMSRLLDLIVKKIKTTVRNVEDRLKAQRTGKRSKVEKDEDRYEGTIDVLEDVKTVPKRTSKSKEVQRQIAIKISNLISKLQAQWKKMLIEEEYKKIARPAPGSKASKDWHRRYRIRLNNYREKCLKPSQWDMQDPIRRQTYSGTPDIAWRGIQRRKVNRKRFNYLLLEYNPNADAFVCHSVESYTFIKDVKRVERTLEEVEAAMKSVHRAAPVKIEDTSSGSGEKRAKLESLLKREVKDTNDEFDAHMKTEPKEEEYRVFAKKEDKTLREIFSGSMPEEGCYDGNRSDDNSEDEELGAEASELTLDEKNKMTIKQRKIKLGIGLLNEGTSLEDVSTSMTEKSLKQQTMLDEDTFDKNDLFNDFMDKDKDEDEDEDDVDAGWNVDSSEDDGEVSDKNDDGPTSSKKGDGEEEDNDTDGDEDDDDSGEEDEDNEAKGVTPQDIRRVLRRAPTGRMEFYHLAKALKSKLTRQNFPAFKNLVRELCEVKTEENKTYVNLKEEEQKRNQRAKARRRREIEREKKRKEKERLRKQNR
mmetsp:Transcript_13183/g.19694  ORF Transcript_13183/g.19694 Transcript_13183/m.19694 type:complete len:648 (+) Transcript_13183:1-1944(+)